MSTIDVVVNHPTNNAVQKTQSCKTDTLSLGDKFAMWIARKVGTLGFFWLCNVLVIMPLILPKTMAVVQFISSGWLQLVLLPLILIYQNIQNRNDELRENIQEEHHAIMLEKIESLEEKIISLEERIINDLECKGEKL